MSKQLNAAVMARLNGSENLNPALYPDQVAAITAMQLATYGSAFDFGFGTLTKQAQFPTIRFYEDVGPQRLPQALDVGIIQDVIYRFEAWNRDWAGDFQGNVSNWLELLFDERKGAPPLQVPAPGKVWEIALFTPMQGPLHDDQINAWYGLMAFRFVESRP